MSGKNIKTGNNNKKGSNGGRLVILAVIALLVAGGLYLFLGPDAHMMAGKDQPMGSANMMTHNSNPSGVFTQISMPELTPDQATGKRRFDAVCAACHGKDLLGTNQGPPLMHKFYHPSHHGDAAFFLAATQGVIAHHWNFGDMPPQPQVPQQDVALIVDYVRAVQKYNGLF